MKLKTPYPRCIEITPQVVEDLQLARAALRLGIQILSKDNPLRKRFITAEERTRHKLRRLKL